MYCDLREKETNLKGSHAVHNRKAACMIENWLKIQGEQNPYML